MVGAQTRAITNPTGKGGFGDHPEHRSTSWRAEDSPNFLRRRYSRYTMEQLREELQKPELTVCQLMVIQQYLDAINQKTSASVRQSIRADICNRLDGMPTQTIQNQYEQAPRVEIEFRDVSEHADGK